MKLLVAPNRRRSGQIMAEACIGLALMVFAWIVITYSLYLANNQIRTEMAARYAAWYQGNNNGSAPSTSDIDNYFFFQSGLSAVNPQTAALIPDALDGQNPTNSVSDSSDGNGPFKIQIAFGPTTTPSSSSPFPFSLLSTHVPYMTDSMMAYSVSSTCQWDGDSDTWNTWTSVGEGLWDTVKNNFSQLGGILGM